MVWGLFSCFYGSTCCSCGNINWKCWERKSKYLAAAHFWIFNEENSRKSGVRNVARILKSSNISIISNFILQKIPFISLVKEINCAVHVQMKCSSSMPLSFSFFFFRFVSYSKVSWVMSCINLFIRQKPATM